MEAPQVPTRKGDIVALEVRHTSHDISLKCSTYVLWHLARVTRASRNGVAREISIGAATHSVQVARVGKIYTVAGDNQARARRLFEHETYPAREYESGEHLRAAILGEGN